MVGHAFSSNGEATVTGEGSSWNIAGTLSVGNFGVGTLIVEGGGIVTSSDGHIGRSVAVSGPASGKVVVRGPQSSWTNGGSLYVGNAGHGTLTIEAGGVVNNMAGFIGTGADSISAATVTGAGSSWNNSGELIVGDEGRGALNITSGGLVTSDSAILAQHEDAQGSAIVSGTDSRWLIGDLTVGNAGTGSLNIGNGGMVRVGSAGDGIVHIAREAGAIGGLTLGAGALEAGEVRFGAGSGALTFNHGAAGYLFAPVITGQGNVSQISGTTILTGENTYTGNTQIGGGVLQIGDHGTSGSIVGNVLIAPAGRLRFARADDWTYSGVVSGFGNVEVSGAGATTLTGDSSAYNGTMTVANGILIVGQGGIGALGGTINVLNGATLGGSGTLGSAGTAVTIAAGGVHAPGNGLGQQTVLGDYVLRGALQIDATAAGTDTLVVHGGVDIAGSTLDLQLSPTTAESWNIMSSPFTIIDNQGPGAVTGTFATVNNNLIFLDPHVDYFGGDGNDVTLDLVRNDNAFASVAITPNQTATGGAIDAQPHGPVWNAIVLMSDENTVRQSFELLSGEIHASSLGVLVEESRFPRIAVNDRIRAAFGTNTDTAVWAHGYGSWANWQGNDSTASLKRNTGGLLLGLDGLLGDWQVGVMTGWNLTGVTVADRASTTEAETWHAGVYGGSEWGNLSLRLGLLHGGHSIETTRTVALPGLSETLRGAYGASTTQAFGELAYTITPDAIRYEPFINLAHIHTQSDGFVEAGGDAALTGRPGAMSATVMTLGQRIETAHDLGGLGVRTSGMIGWQHVFDDTASLSTHGFSAGNDFTIAGTPFAQDSLLVEAGLEVSLSPTATIRANYTGRFAPNGQDNAVSATLRVDF